VLGIHAYNDGMRLGIVLIVMVVGAGPAAAQRTCEPAKDKDCRVAKVVKSVQPPPPPVINIGPLDLVGKVRGAMMMEFLERASAELERASLERRSFVPELVRSVDREAL
jgi:hypothetical protein